MNLNISRDWLLRMADKEANGIISVGGLPSQIARTVASCDHPAESVTPGPNVPRRYGSYRSQVCEKCGGHRVGLHRESHPEWQAWEPGAPVIEDDDDC